jgi:hypothetical protein
MKAFVFVISFLSVGFAQAGYNCVSPEGDKVIIDDVWRRGLSARVESQRLTDFYRKHINRKVSYLESIIDPETSKYLTEEQQKGFIFALQADQKAGLGNMWSLDFAWVSATTATGLIMDTEGNGLKLNLTCSETPNLE